MSKKQPTNTDLLNEIERLREEVQRLAARPIVIQPYPVLRPYVEPYPWTRPYITWTAPITPTVTGGTSITATPMDNTTTTVWKHEHPQHANGLTPSLP